VLAAVHEPLMATTSPEPMAWAMALPALQPAVVLGVPMYICASVPGSGESYATTLMPLPTASAIGVVSEDAVTAETPQPE
jgi:hypothetical protein